MANFIGGLSGIEPAAKITFSLAIEGEVEVGLNVYAIEADVEAANLASGYSFTYDLLQQEWEISRGIDLALGTGKVAAQYSVRLKDLLNPDSEQNDTIEISLSAGAGRGFEVGFGAGQILQAGLDASFTKDFYTVEVSTTLATADFLNNYVEQSTLADGLADLFIPYVGDSWWENLVTSAASFIPIVGLEELLNAGRGDTPLGILVASDNVTVAVKEGLQLVRNCALCCAGRVRRMAAPSARLAARVASTRFVCAIRRGNDRRTHG